MAFFSASVKSSWWGFFPDRVGVWVGVGERAVSDCFCNDGDGLAPSRFRSSDFSCKSVAMVMPLTDPFLESPFVFLRAALALCSGSNPSRLVRCGGLTTSPEELASIEVVLPADPLRRAAFLAR